MLCQEWSLVKRDGRQTVISPLYCRSWSCPVCAPRRQRELKKLARDGEPTTFITLTSNAALYHSPHRAAQDLSRCWRIIRQRAMRKYRLDQFPFLAVFEKTKRGMPHLHIICRVRWIDQAWLADQMRELMSSPIVDIRRVKGVKQAAAYVSKYLAKDPARFDGTKRYWRSQDWVDRPDTEDGEEDVQTAYYWVERINPDDLARQYLSAGWVGIKDKDEWYLAYGWPDERGPPGLARATVGASHELRW